MTEFNSNLKMTTPYHYQNKSTFYKAYWDFDESDWRDWFDSFRNLPIALYAKHIESVINMYC